MNYALLWIDFLIVWLLWVGFWAACIGRIRRKWLRVVLLVIAIMLPVIPLGGFLTASVSMKFVTKVSPNWFGYSLSLLLLYVIGALIIVGQSRRQKPGMAPPASNWRRIPLALAMLIVAGIGYMALLNMDTATRARCAILSVNAAMQYWAAAPAVTSESANAAPIYIKVFKLIPENAAVDILNPPFGDKEQKFNPNEPATIAFLTKYANALAQLHRAAQLPACRFDMDLEDPSFAQILPDLHQVRYGAMALDLDAREQVAHGHVAGAINDISSIFGMSRHFGQRPLIIYYLVGVAIDGLGVEALERTLPAVKDINDLAGLHLDDLLSPGRMLQQALRGEEQFGLTAYCNMPWNLSISHIGSNGSSIPPLSSTSNPGVLFVRVFWFDPNQYIRLLQTSQAQAVQPYYKIKNRLLDSNRGNLGLFVSILAPAFSREVRTNAIAVASDACARVAVAATRYRLDHHGTMPGRLGELVPKYLDEIPTDPFDGKPIRMVKKNNQWIIYSVGPNGVDDGGVELNQRKETGDVIFTLAASAKPSATATKP